jgi:hypothetical protein
MAQNREDTDAQLIQKLRSHLLALNDDNVRMRLRLQQLERENARLKARLGDHGMSAYTTPPGGLRPARPASTPRLRARPPSESLVSWTSPPRTDSIASLENVETRRVPSEAEEVSPGAPPEAARGRAE